MLKDFVFRNGKLSQYEISLRWEGSGLIELKGISLVVRQLLTWTWT